MQPITTEHIDFMKPPQEGFFKYKEHQNCPALVVGQIQLPITPLSNTFYLLYDRGGEYHWVPAEKVTFVSQQSRAIDSSPNVQIAKWFRVLYNGYEPDNTIQLTGDLTPDGTTYVVFEMSGRLVFRDGDFFVSILKTEDGQFLWRKDDKTGVAGSFLEAWNNMPSYVTNPDDYEDLPTFLNDLPLMPSISEDDVIAGQTEF